MIGAMGDKDLEGMMLHLRGLVGSVVATAVDYERAVPADRVAEVATSVFDAPVELVSSVGEALETARRLAGDEGSILVTGSLYVVGEARTILLDR